MDISVATKIKGFISYSHANETLVKELMLKLELLVKGGQLSLWYDRMIDVGTKWEPEIEEQLTSSHLIVFCITKDFLVSDACRSEFRKAIELMKDKNAEIVPIIVDACDWTSEKEISDYQAIPEYGHPVTSFDDRTVAYEQIRAVMAEKIAVLKRRMELRVVEEHEAVLQSIDPLLALSGAEHLNLKLEDIYVDPELRARHEEGRVTETIVGATLIEKLVSGQRIIVSGESQSGKTSFCRKLCLDLFKKHYLPIYVDSMDGYNGSLNRQITRLATTQYSDPECVPESRRVIILDDFYKCRKPAAYLADLPKCCSVLIILDDVYDLNMQNAAAFKEYEPYALMPMRAGKRNELIRKWLAVQSEEGHEPFDNFKSRDRLTSNVEVGLGKMFGKGIIPAYPFYVLAILITSEFGAKPLNQEISSQGYCYQALLYAVLRRVGVNNRHVDMYVNFLTELAYMLFKKGGNCKCTDEELDAFIKDYQKRFNLPLSVNEVLDKLAKGGVFRAYIAIFMSHHDRSVEFLANVKDQAEHLFEGTEECYLTAQDLRRFEQQSRSLIQAALPALGVDPEKERERYIERTERREVEVERRSQDDEEEDVSLRELIASMRLCQVLGMILKSRPGSIQKVTQKELVRSTIRVYARIIRKFFDTFKDEASEKAIIDFIAYSITKGKPNASKRESQIRDLATRAFWNLNFVATHNMMIHCVGALGSDELSGVIHEACDDDKEHPLMLMIPFVVDVIFKKRVDVDGMRAAFPKLPNTVRSMLKLVVARFCAIHHVTYSDRQKVEQLFELPKTLPGYLANK